ncbi:MULTISPECIES: sterol desaturase family protein [unclassified Leisingera]|uniref:sterol desaturase family protein n=1 Tax=unclassified Leisingera TaxID=2614906 RepID=UPI0002D7EEED|nr:MULTISPECIES: sterol desaturase family protein [unclassified Leisingera]KIC25593.1 desaturase [Leisingera sp. ANG-S3]KIC54303.1 desaturase [Leisingera sp. ANG-S]KID10876.1 desaturase [Leisingera sp. ANG1]
MDGTLHTAERDREAERWHYHPKGPVPLNPLFSWPPRPAAVLRWYRGAWMEITALSVPFVLALMAYAWFLPPLAEMASFNPGWMLQVWLANLVPQAAVAGGLHWWLYMRKGQGMQKKFDKRDLSRGNGTFTFKNQVLDNIWWTLGSAITVATVYQWGIYWLMANGWVPVVTFAEAPVWCVVWMLFIPMWSGLHFYWVHRLEHHPKLYKHVHAVHHRNVNTGPWSGISNHWYENLLYFTTYFIHLIVPSHPLHLAFHAMFQQISPVLSHSGFERVIAKETEAAKAGDFFHQLHHRYFECNYGTSEIPFDKWFGTYHDGSAAATERTRAFKKQMYTR